MRNSIDSFVKWSSTNISRLESMIGVRLFSGVRTKTPRSSKRKNTSTTKTAEFGEGMFDGKEDLLLKVFSSYLIFFLAAWLLS